MPIYCTMFHTFKGAVKIIEPNKSPRRDWSPIGPNTLKASLLSKGVQIRKGYVVIMELQLFL